MKRVLLLSILLITTNAFAQENKRDDAGKKPTAVQTKRGVVVLRNASPKSLATVLAAHFKGDAEILAAPETTGNYILVHAPAAVFDEVIATIDRLDRKLNAVAVDVFIVELPAKNSDDDRSLDERGLSGSLGEVANRLNALQKSGKLAGLKRIQLTTLEGQACSLSLGENKPVVMGAMTSARGTSTKQITFHNVGTLVKLTPQILSDGNITLELNVQDSGIRNSSTTISSDEKGGSIPASEFTNASFTGKISVAPGKAMLVKDARTSSKDAAGGTLVIVGARVIDPDAKPK